MPDWMTEIRARLAAARLDPARELEIAQELASHLDDRYAELLETGMPPDEARRAALDELKDDARTRKELASIERRESTLPPAGAPARAGVFQGLWQDLRYTLRVLRVNRSFTALAVLTLAIGIGATTAIYAVVDNVLLRPLGYRDADRLVKLHETDAARPDVRLAASYAHFEEWRRRSRTLEAIAIYNSSTLVLLDDEPQRVTVAVITPQFFDVNGVAPSLGRGFTDADGDPGAERVLMVSPGAWQRRFGGDPAILGRAVRTTAGPYVVVGVAPQANFFRGTSEFWLPFRRPSSANAGIQMHPVLARTKDGVTLEQVQADMDAVARSMAAEQEGASSPTGVVVQPLREWTVGHLRTTLFMLLGAVGCILLIACVNVAGLLVARGASRTRELSVRLALGASRWRIARQLLTESVTLASAGGLAGALLAWWLISALVPLLPVRLPAANPVAIDARVLAVALGASALCGVMFGLLPAWRLSGVGASRDLRESHQSTSRWSRRTGKTLVTLELALCLVLLAGAGLMVRTLMALYAVDPGIDARRVLALNASPVLPADADPQRAVAFYRELVGRVSGVPGVEAAGGINSAPFSWSTIFSSASVEGHSSPVPVSPRSITPGYFGAMGIPLLDGRDFTDADRAGAPLVVIINQSAADRLWPGENPLGRELRIPGPPAAADSGSSARVGTRQSHVVVGMAGDVRHMGLDRDILLEVYHPYGQHPDAEMTVVARAAVPAAVASLVAAQTRDLPEPVLTRPVRTFDAMIAGTTEIRRNRAALLALAAVLGLIMAAVGVVGVTAYSVNQRTREIGIRMALGAEPRAVIRTIMGGLAWPVATGIVLGLCGAWAASRSVEAFLFGVEPADPVAFAAAAVGLATAALVACYIPARRALRVDPVTALRAE